MNIVEQYNSFKDMPANFTSAFTEELYLSKPARLPTSTLRPNLGDGKGYYSNLYPPLAGQEANSTSRYTKYIKISRNCQIYQLKLERASGVPIPNAEFVDYSNIVGREVRIGIFDEKSDSFVANILNLECRWT